MTLVDAILIFTWVAFTATAFSWLYRDWLIAKFPSGLRRELHLPPWVKSAAMWILRWTWKILVILAWVIFYTLLIIFLACIAFAVYRAAVGLLAKILGCRCQCNE